MLCAVNFNTEKGYADTAKTIIEILADRFKRGFSLDQIEDFNCEEIAEFICQKYGGSHYGDKFGNPPLRLVYMPLKIKENKLLKLNNSNDKSTIEEPILIEDIDLIGINNFIAHED